MAEWPLYGRDDEIAHLGELLGDPDARGVVLAGPQGVGKTRLGLECLRIARERGLATERISATYAASSLPLGAVTLSRAPQNAVVASPAEQAELVHRIAGDLVRQAGGRRLVLLVDDVHWLDQLSAVLVHQLALSGAAFVVLTARTGTPAPDAIVALWKEEIIERMSVRPMSREAIEPLLADVLGSPVAGPAVAALSDSAAGNMLFLREQVIAAMENGSLVLDSDVWRLDPGSAPPARLVELIEHRLSGLGPEARAALEMIAFGEPLELADTVAFMPEELIRDLEPSGLIAVRADGWGGAKVLLGHPVIGEVLRAETSVLRARRITALLADTAEARRPTHADELLRIASWRLVCGGGTPELMAAATATAHGRRDYELASRLGRSAVALGAGFETRLLLAQAEGFLGHRDHAESEMATLARSVSEPDQAAAVAHARIVQAHLNGDIALGERVYRDAVESIEDPQWRAELTAKRSWLVIMQEGPRGALRAIEEIWNSAIAGSPLVSAAIVRTAACARAGLVTKAIEASDRGWEAHASLSQPFDLHPLVLDFYRCEALAMAGRLREYEQLAQARYTDAVRERTALMQLFYAYQQASAALARGRVATAARLAGEAVGIAHQLNDHLLRAAALTILAESLALRGEPDAAARALAELDTIAHLTPWSFAEPDIARAWLAVGRGDLVSARRLLQDEVERSLARDDRRAVSLALHSLVRIGDATLAEKPLLELARHVEGDLVPTQARHATAVLSGDGEALDEVALAFAAMGATLLAAEAYCDGAAAFRAAGDQKRASASSQRASLLLEKCEGARSPACQPLSVRTELTQAERRTAMLAAQGRSNKEIADAQQLSVRTVESRLQCVYTKLGISSRRDLAEQLSGGAG